MANRTPWNYVRVDPFLVERNPFVNPSTPPPPPPPSGGSSPLHGNYVLMPQTITYARGVQALRDAYARRECPTQPLFTGSSGTPLVRPLTFKENIEARVKDYESNKGKAERLRLFARWLDSCTGIAYQKKTGKFKVIPMWTQSVF